MLTEAQIQKHGETIRKAFPDFGTGKLKSIPVGNLNMYYLPFVSKTFGHFPRVPKQVPLFAGITLCCGLNQTDLAAKSPIPVSPRNVYGQLMPMAAKPALVEATSWGYLAYTVDAVDFAILALWLNDCPNPKMGGIIASTASPYKTELSVAEYKMFELGFEPLFRVKNLYHDPNYITMWVMLRAENILQSTVKPKAVAVRALKAAVKRTT